MQLLARPRSTSPPPIDSPEVATSSSDRSTPEDEDDSAPSSATLPPVERTSSPMTFEEREEEYRKARARIFSETESSDGEDTVTYPSGEKVIPTKSEEYTVTNFE